VTDRIVPALTRLTLTDFRNYAGLRLETAARLVALAGPNGAGKTNLLEAISLFAAGRGLRGAGYDELARLGGSSTWAIAAELRTAAGPVSLGTGWTRANGDSNAADQSRLVIIDGHVQKSSGAFGGYLRLIWLTPAMDRLFAGPASDRRRFLDRLVTVFDPEHGSRVAVFEKLMRERNLLLEDRLPDHAWLDSLEAHMAEAGVAIAAARTTAVETLQGHIGEGRTDSAFPWGELTIDGEIEALVAATPAVRAEDEYRSILRDSRKSDGAAGRTLSGPHRSDLAVVHGPKSMAAAQCSTGEQKALLIGLILAQARAVKREVGVPPILLLDEIAAHLDRARRLGLFAALAQLECQAWMTGTEVELFAELEREAEVFRVEAGRILETVKA
jgi:DNA replication and repair protein RecF